MTSPSDRTPPPDWSGTPQPGGVEIDDVEPGCPSGHEAAGQVHRVPVLVLPIEVALGEPHRTAVAYVDGGIELHHRSASWTAPTKLARMPSPTAPDFSGWNWVPHTVPRSDEAVTWPP